MTFAPPFQRTFSPTFDRRAAAAGKLLISDVFTDTDGVLLSAHTIAPTNVPAATWTYQAHGSLPGTYQINSNAVIQSAFSVVPEYFVDCGYADCVIDVDITTSSAAINGQSAYILFRNTNNANFWYAGFDTLNTLTIREFTAGVDTVRATTTFTKLVSTLYHLKVTLNGSSITLDLSGGATLQRTFSSSVRATVTKHGLLSFFSATSGRYDNFTINRL